MSPLIDYEKQIAVTGDWCIQGRVEAAYLSSLRTYKELINIK